LRRRPDIIEAENNIEVAAGSLGIAKRDYLPSLSIEASVGTQAHRFGDLFTGPSFTYTVAPTLSWTIFSGFGRNAAMAEAKQNLELQIDNYNLTVLTAVEEVRNALCKYTATLKYIDAIKEVVHSSQESVNLSLDLYKQGLSNFTNVVDAQLNLLSYQNTLISARGDALTALVDLYKALGGGWYD
ncbi:MAG: TolC family protein, partial [Muribaculaceae bacterium]|nr:TolC family protein [Muribaculaceae bacterium]